MAQGACFRLSHMMGMLGLWGGLLGWSWLADRVSCPLGALILAPLWGLLTLSGSELALLRRARFIRHYLAPSGRLAHWLGRRFLLLSWQALKALVLALALLMGTLSVPAMQWVVLLADVLLFATLVVIIDWLLEGEINPSLGGVLVREWAHRVNALLLWLALTTSLYFAAHEDYQGLGPAAVVRWSALGVSVGCDALAVLARLGAVSDGLLWWGAERVLGGLRDPTELLVAWVGFLAAFGVSFLVAWSYSRALAGILAAPWRGLSGISESP